MWLHQFIYYDMIILKCKLLAKIKSEHWYYNSLSKRF